MAAPRHMSALSSHVVICNIHAGRRWYPLISPAQMQHTRSTQPGRRQHATRRPYQINERRNTAMTQWPLCVRYICFLGDLDTILAESDMGVHAHLTAYAQMPTNAQNTHTHKHLRRQICQYSMDHRASSRIVHQQLGVRYHITDWLQRHEAGHWIRTWSIWGKEIQELILKWTELN